MTFKELQKTVEKKLGASKLSDIALELNVTPQVVSNWKARNQVPYKYVLLLRKRIKKAKENSDDSNFNLSSSQASYIREFNEDSSVSADDQTFTEFVASIYLFLVPSWKIIIIFPVLFFLFALLYLNNFASSVYTSSAKLLPISGEKSSSRISGIASQFGIGLDQKLSSGLSSASMVPEIIKSRLLAKDLLKVEFNTDFYDTPLPLINILAKNTNKDIIWSDLAVNAYATLLLLEIEIIEIKNSSLIELVVYGSEPKMTKDIADAIIDRLNVIMKRFKVSQVKEKKHFIKNRLDEIKEGLRNSEEQLKNFRINNRSISSSPGLLLEQSRLIREVEVQTQVYITLKQEFEMVRIEEIDISTVVQVLDPPEIPVNRIKPNSTKTKLIFIITGIFLSFAYVIIIDWFKKNRNSFKQN